MCIELPSPEVTRNHAELHGSTVGWSIVDERSKNGTLVDGRRLVGQSARLLDGSIIEIAPYLFVFRMVRGGSVPPVEPMSLQCEVTLPHPPGLATFNQILAGRLAELRKLAPTNLPVLILGQTGTGKERVARAVHDLSGRRGAFVAVNCGAIQPSTMMAELFGHRKNAFTGAEDHRPGYIRSADGGTLFLDEVGELSVDAQKALLRALQEREVLPLGADHPVKVDVRVVAATNRDVDTMVERGHFRSDLLARLRGFDLVLPRLTERREDFGLIIRDFIQRGRIAPDLSITSRAYLELLAYSWPQNIRELENVLVRAAGLATGKRIDIEHLPPMLQDRRPKTEPPMRPTPRITRPFDPGRKEDVVELLAVHGGNVAAAAHARGVSDRQVRRWIEKHQLDVNGFRKLRST
jgi:DNA-binding NtrC family response regulator